MAKKLTDWELDQIYRKGILLVGGSESGKTTIIKSICVRLAGKIAKAFIFSETEPINKSFSNYLFPEGCVRNSVNVEEVFNIISNQAHQAAIKKKGNDYKYLSKLVKKYYPGGDQMVEDLDKKRSILKIDTEFDRFETTSINILRNLVRKNIIKRTDLTDEEREVCDLLDTNIDLLLIFDDVSRDLPTLLNATNPYKDKKSGDKKKFFKSFLDTSRHMRSTVIIAAHAFIDVIPTDMRSEGLHVMIFLQRHLASQLYDRKSQKEKQELDKVMPTEKEFSNYWKLVKFRDSGYFHFKADMSIAGTVVSVTPPVWANFCKIINKKINNKKILF